MSPTGLGLNLNAIFTDGYGGTVTYSNPTSSNPEVATVAIVSGILSVVKVSSGSTTVTFDVADSHGVKKTITYYLRG
ncbi:hypothetical protein E8L90_13190 [Brevibacillus antibioticus]|uniref:BIG2 domain-containing protein n=1 Tax=Brevibacillus antibioticus TaxID=2570228 RepID=A0A4V5TIR8_9BACL|nr:hypothetical protein [Brevibacillus antibioticus]TKI56343.1 hypothetical protein E8L90_13190 [Brevibacillus antibioticus]